MKSKLTHNLGLKIVSLLAAIILWAVVTGVSDPAITKTFYDVKVELLNTDTINNSSKVYEVLNGTDVIPKVTVKAARSVMAELSKEDIVATANVDQLSSLDTASIAFNNTKDFEHLISITGNIDSVKLNIENRKTMTLALTPKITGTPAEGYVAGEATVGQNLVRITGAASIVNSISKAVAEVDVTNFSQNIGTTSEIKLYTDNDEPVDISKVSLNMQSVSVKVSILRMKDVPITFAVEGEAAPGYCATGEVLSDKDIVSVCGNANVIDELSSIEIPSSAINIADAKADFVTEIDVDQYLPTGVLLVDPATALYTVTVYIEPEVSKHIGISTDDVKVLNVPDGYKASIGVDEGTILDLVGLSDDLSTLNKDDIMPSVDVTAWMTEQGIEKLEEGFYSVPVSFILPPGVRTVDTITAILHVVEEELR